MNESDALKVLRARFPDAGILIDCITWRNDQAHFVFTDLPEGSVGRIAIPLPYGPHEINVEEVSLALQNRIVHGAREKEGTLHNCPCQACTIRRLRATLKDSKHG
jgi:hypothetical protein